MPAQPDMFTAEDDPDPPIANAIDEPCSPPALPSLAIPCGFQNRNNQPCQRLAYDVVSIDGVDLIHRGHQLLKCESRCWRDEYPPPDPDCPF